MHTTAHYHLVLVPGAEPGPLEALFSDGSMEGVLQLTRITSGFGSRLLRAGRHYIWEVNGTLVAGHYDFEQNVERLQARVAEHATVFRVESFDQLSVVD